MKTDVFEVINRHLHNIWDTLGYGLTIEEAIARIVEEGVFGRAFGFTEETLKTYWTKYPELQNEEMHFPD